MTSTGWGAQLGLDPSVLETRLVPSHTTLARSTTVVAFFVAAIRLGTLLQMLPSSFVAASVSARPGLCVLSWVLAVAATVAAAGLCLVRRRPPGSSWALVDVVVAVSVLLLGTLTVPEDLRSGSWVGFQPGYTIAVACSLVTVRHLGRWAVLVAAMALGQGCYMLPLLQSHSVDLASAVGHLLTLLVLSLLTRAGAVAVLQLARTADDHEALAVAVVQEEEARRGRMAVHNAAATMSLLLELDRPPGAPEAHETRARADLLAQAASELVRMRSYLRRDDRDRGRDGRSPDVPVMLRDVVADVMREATDLDLDVQTDLAPTVALDPEVSADLAAALRSLLLNVRHHAGTHRVVVHATENGPHGRWQLTVHDDGVGFDVASTPQHSGLADVVVGQLGRHGVEVTIDSLPGSGTTITLAGSRSGPDRRGAAHA